MTNAPRARIDRVVTHGVLISNGQKVALDNNVWIIGDDHEVIIIDAAHSASDIVDAVNGRSVKAIVCTHAHNDHINAVEELCAATDAPVYLNPADAPLWHEKVERPWDEHLTDGLLLQVADVELRAIHTPGHTPGASCLYVEKLGTLFSGDTLFEGGPGATRFEYSSFPTIIDSITTRLLTLPAETKVLTGHGPETSIGAEAKDVEAWIARGY